MIGKASAVKHNGFAFTPNISRLTASYGDGIHRLRLQ
jgi:hypothetical protein